MWLLSPRGMLYLLITGSILLFGFIMNVGGLFIIAATRISNASVSLKQILAGLFASMRSLLHLSASIFLFSLPFVLLLAIGPGVAFLVFMTGHDINYYLTNRPPEFYITIGIGILGGASSMPDPLPVIRWLFNFPCGSKRSVPCGRRRNQAARPRPANSVSCFGCSPFGCSLWLPPAS